MGISQTKLYHTPQASAAPLFDSSYLFLHFYVLSLPLYFFTKHIHLRIIGGGASGRKVIIKDAR